MAFLEIEDRIVRLFDVAFPVRPEGGRTVKPLIAPVLGCAAVDPNIRMLLTRREYRKFDAIDFLDFATSTLPRPPRLGDFVNNELALYDAFDLVPNQPMVLATEKGIGVTVLGAAIARHDVIVSVTMRFAVHGTGFVDSHLATMTFAPPTNTSSVVGEDSSLEEWDRYSIFPPTPGDDEWRFNFSGIYTDELLAEMEKHPEWEGSISPSQIEQIRSQASALKTEYGTFFELARLGLLLPSYFDFMYDLIVNERVPQKPPVFGNDVSVKKSASPVQANPTYKIVKSIRVIRVGSTSPVSPRTWSAPKYQFAVRGHWRHYSDSSTVGHSPEGDKVLGRTWVRPFIKGPAISIENVQSETAEPHVTIEIKEPLAYAQDLIAAHQQDGTKVDQTPDETQPTSNEKPSEEWRARERSKLSAGLRYAIMRRDGFRCRLCGKSASDENSLRLEVDHVVSVDQWGRTTEDNLWTLCLNCNRGKANKSLNDPHMN